MTTDSLRKQVEAWFTPEALVELLGDPESDAASVAQAWLQQDGRRWRPFLTAGVCASLQAPRAPSRDVRRLAVAVECFHKASLIHDDIEDGDTVRYGLPTLHARLGLPVALNAGDYLLGEGYRQIGATEVSASRKA